MLDDQDGVAEVAQAHERGDQAVVVALVQADARLVEDVGDADERRADLGGEADALGLAAGQGHRRAVEGEVAEADLEHEAQALARLREDRLGDLVALLAELEALEEGQQLLERPRRRSR